MRFLKEKDVKEIHAELLDLTRRGSDPVSPGTISPGAIRSATERARWGPFRGGGDLAERAALLIRGIAQEHPFTDGNKRTAFEAAAAFLELNAHRLHASDDDVVDVMVAVARGELRVVEIAAWLRKRMRKV